MYRLLCLEMNWEWRDLIEPYEVIEWTNWGDSWVGDVKRELGLYICVCIMAVCAPTESIYADFIVLRY